MAFCRWEEHDWSCLISAIHEGQCILLLGPDSALLEQEGKTLSLNDLLAHELLKEIDENTKKSIDCSYLPEVLENYALNNRMGQIDLFVKIKQLYKQYESLPSNFHRDLASLPFYFAITTSHDHHFRDSLIGHAKIPSISWYDFRMKKYYNGSDLEFSTEKPFLFYMFGTLESPNSLVLTQKNLLDFLVSINRDSIFSPTLIEQLKDPNKIFLFIGFGFRHWYLRILLHMLKIDRKDNRSFALEDFDPRDMDELRSTVFFYKQSVCNIHLYKNNLNAFSAELRRRYEEVSTTAAHPIPVQVEPEKKRPRVFICHASENKDQASSLYERLKKKGFEPWLDKENLRGGDRWSDEIKNVISREIDYFLVLQSQALMNKKIGYVNLEIKEALERHKYFRGTKFIIPVQIETSSRLKELEDFQTIDLEDEKGFEKLCRDIRRDYTKRGIS
ncbi:MAG: toll/interleukin-1 receptor domain-containing protein [Candidatus Aminicenantes bacterium]|jgi:hypothetical protein